MHPPTAAAGSRARAAAEPRSLMMRAPPGHAEQLPQVPLTFIEWRGTSCVPSHVAGRAVAWLPDHIRIVRNVALYACIVELCMGMLSIPLADARGNLAKASAGVHAVLSVVAALGVFGALRLNHYATAAHVVLAVGIPAIFVLWLILSLTVSAGTRDSDDAIVLVIFIVCVFDFIAGMLNALLTWKVMQYRSSCEAADAAFMLAAQSHLRSLPQPPHMRSSHEAGQQQDDRVFEADVVPPNHARMFAAASCIPTGAAGSSAAVEPQRAPSRHDRAVADAAAFDIVIAQPVVPSGGSRVAAPGARTCAICCDRPCDACIYECGHMCCSDCAQRLRTLYGRCAMCRKPIKDIVRLYT